MVRRSRAESKGDAGKTRADVMEQVLIRHTILIHVDDRFPRTFRLNETESCD